MKKKSVAKLHFLGASETVTGSKYLIETPDINIMVDCGMFQGLKKLRELNWNDFPFDPSLIDVVLLTHGHLDHVGFLPRLVKLGFRGTIIATEPTIEIAKIILRDSAGIQEEEAEKANKHGYASHSPAEPLYTIAEAERAIKLMEPLQEGKWHKLAHAIKVRFMYNGHIIGSTFIEMDIHSKRFVFSGDIGRMNDYLLGDPKKPKKADVLLIESTYGDRLHPDVNVKETVRRIIKETYDKDGTVLIPSFAVERTQILMYILWQMVRDKELPKMMMVMDSPMGANVLRVFQDFREWHKLSYEECEKMCEQFRIVRSYSETVEIMNIKKPKIVIAGSGMLSGGRILSYLTAYLGKPETTVMIVGFQAEGTRGRQLLEGASEIKIHGRYFPVKAKTVYVPSLSAHADQAELLDWLNEIEDKPEDVFIVHGERHAADAFRVKLKDTYGWYPKVPELNSVVEIMV